MFHWNDVEASRQLIAAVVTLVLFVVTAPRGRRWLARGALLLLLNVTFLPEVELISVA